MWRERTRQLGGKKVNRIYMGGMAQEKVKGQELKETELKRI